MKRHILASLLASALISLPITAPAQSTEEAADTTAVQPVRIANGTRFGAWTVNCEAIAVNETACVLSQSLVRTSDNVFLAELLAFWSADQSKTYMAARVPNGVFFPSGFALKPGDSDTRQDFVWQSCSADICEALIEMPLETFAALEGAEEVIAGYRPNLRSEPVIFRLSVGGASDGLNALKASMAEN